ncbi:hypothetical protein H8356DRAFT_1352274 [Neocallimastix lanati (nom. inval.)]|nr:hypothetical protein H8356DRAFT_1352274 [Neocallimastix sp. JGI-2020a]
MLFSLFNIDQKSYQVRLELRVAAEIIWYQIVSNKHTSMRFVPNNRDNPDDCDIKGYVNIKNNKCYCTSYRSVRYYDRVVYQDPNSKTNVEIALTEYGC